MTDKRTITFLPGCFNSFDGTQEELDEFIKELTNFFENASEEELLEKSTPLTDSDTDDIEELFNNFLNSDKKALN